MTMAASSQGTERLRAIISGRVQGVGFRMFVLEAARRHKCLGWVRNLPDGRVETEAEGNEDALTELLTELYRGPVLSRVEDIDVTWSSGEQTYEDFQIRR